ncbi:hypothetical protein AKJ52_01960 [candidate division MSBL1 archaeon SCGC-AAA382C18]|uniref:Uncharacterized protein n=1 Tax=candidate division MSBL1 archaeon SCGC-AAA382C18 TaxID=1698281 RepID=A0A133VJK0_9EURY|nr:hypothetical protein AKJ52_01960 [candidate division MSBL1 archaeon SCGC-AAA382C18]
MKRGQFTVEFILVLAVFLTVMATVSMPLYNNSRDTAQEGTELMKAREAAGEIASALDTLYASGIGARKKTTFWLPENVSEVSAKAVDNELAVTITVKMNETREVQSDTLLPSDWENRMDLGSIKGNPENPTYHEIVITLQENHGYNQYFNISEV